jgi:hypothetical protein
MSRTWEEGEREKISKFTKPCFWYGESPVYTKMDAETM